MRAYFFINLLTCGVRFVETNKHGCLHSNCSLVNSLLRHSIDNLKKRDDDDYLVGGINICGIVYRQLHCIFEYEITMAKAIKRRDIYF
jgi:hypothetical protein